MILLFSAGYLLPKRNSWVVNIVKESDLFDLFDL